MSHKNSDYYFLRGGGEMGELIRAKDWSKTSLGDPAHWPQSLRTMVAVMLDNPFGMYIAWGSDYTQLYNDGYRPILGATKHPEALGISTRETFSEIWHIIESMFGGVMKGKAVGFPDFMLPLNRNGFVEECYFDFSYSPIRKDDGEVGGVLVTVIETTEKKRATEALKESNARFINNIMQAPVAMCIFRGKNHIVEIANEQMLNLWGKHADEVLNKPIFEGLPEAKNQGLEALVDHVYATGEKFVANERPVNLPRNGKAETTYINFIYDALKEANGTISGIVATAIDVTSQVLARKKIEESDNKLRSLIENAPFPIGVFTGTEMKIELANESIIKAWGKGNDVKGKLFKELVPEVKSQKIFEQLDAVFATGIPFHAHNQYLKIVIDGKEQPYYYNYSFTPVFDSSGKVYGVMNTASDVTDLNLAREKIEDSQAQLQNVFRQAPAAIALLEGAAHTFGLANSRYQKMTSRSEEQLLGKTMKEVFPELEGTGTIEIFDNVFNTGQPFSMAEYPLMVDINNDGIMQQQYFNFTAEPIKAEGKVASIMVMIYNITEQVEARKKIEDSETRLQLITDALPVLIAYIDKNRTYRFNNKAYETWFGHPNTEIYGKHIADVLGEAAYKNLKPNMDKVLSGKPVHLEMPVPYKDGGTKWVVADYIPHFGKDNEVLGFYSVVNDVTTIKEGERLNWKLAAIVQSSEDAIISKTLDGIITSWNPGAEKIFGYSAAEMIGKPIHIIIPPDRREEEPSLINQISNGETVHHFETKRLHKDGKLIDISLTVSPIRDNEGNITGASKIARDITNEKLQQQELEESEQKFRLLADSMPQLIWTLDTEGNLNYHNQSLLNYSGLSLEQINEDGWIQIVHPDEREENIKQWIDSVSTGKDFLFEHRFRRHDGEYRWQLSRAIPQKDEQGKIQMWVGTSTDIQEQKTFAKELEEQVITRTAELKASEEKFYNLFNLSPISKTLSDVSTGKIVMVNDAFTRLLGYSLEDSIGKSSAELGLLDLEAREIIISELKANGKIENKEIWFIKKSGERFVALASAEVITMGDKQFFLSAFNDISEIKKAEQYIKQKNIELENKTIQLEEAQHLAHIGSWEWDVVANKIEWSDELFRIFGLTPQEFKADYENYLKYIHPDDREYVNSKIQLALKDHQPYSLFHKVACADGKVRILSATGRVITNGIGNVIRMSGTAQDVTEQKNYEEELKISEERFYKIFDSNPVPMSLSEIGNSKIRYANNRFYNAFGYAKEEVIGRSSEELRLLDPEENKRVVNLIFGYLLENRTLAEVQALSKEEKEALLLKLKQSEKMKDFEILYTRKNGETFPALVSYEVIRIGVDSYTVTSYQDITERKRAEALLRSQNDQLEKMNKELESFAYISSHDLQEPLRKIQTFASRISEKEENNLSDYGKDMFNRMQDSAKRMQTLIQDLLAYSRSSTSERKFETTDLNKIVAEVKEDLKEDLKEKQASIEAHQLCNADIIPFQFRQLMHNLIGNSLKFFNPENPPHIQIKSEIANGIKFNNEKLSPQSKYCHITVSDNGIGFDQQYSEKIFEVFQRLHNRNEYNGTGIGLSIVKRIVENHNGIITAYGELNKGATFEIYIPAP